MKEITVDVSNIDCAACVKRLDRALRRLEGVSSAASSHVTGSVRIGYDETKLGIADIVRCIKRAGFEVGGEKLLVSCKGDPEQAAGVLRKLESVSSAETRDGAVEVTLWLAEPDIGELAAALRSAGIEAVLEREEKGSESGDDSAKLLRSALFGAFCLIPIVWDVPDAVKLVFAAAVWLLPGWYFIRRAARGIKTGVMSPELPTVLAALIVLIGSGYMQCALITVISLFGKYFEWRLFERMELPMRRLMRLRPKTALVISDGECKELDAEQLRTGDEIFVRSGERVPADGVIKSGSCTVDESLLSGSDSLVQRCEGERLTAGTLVRRGEAVLTVICVGRGTALGKAIESARRAGTPDVPQHRRAVKAASLCVPIAIAAAAAVFFARRSDIYAASAVLAAVSPNAIALAYPTALISAVGDGIGSIGRENFVFAALYNIAAITLAALGILTPSAAAAVGVCAPLIVMLNSLRLQKSGVTINADN